MLPNRYNRKLIAVEGIHGSGKSTRITFLTHRLHAPRYAVAFSEWNCSPPAGQTALRGHAADFAGRTKSYIQPLVNTGGTVCADRYGRKGA